jgi:hypothetical protein
MDHGNNVLYIQCLQWWHPWQNVSWISCCSDLNFISRHFSYFNEINGNVTKVVMLGVRRLTGGCNGRASGRACPLYQARTRCIGHILLIFFKNTSNILEYARIYSIFLFQVGTEVLRARRAGAQTILNITGWILMSKATHKRLLTPDVEFIVISFLWISSRF